MTEMHGSKMKWNLVILTSCLGSIKPSKSEYEGQIELAQSNPQYSVILFWIVLVHYGDCYLDLIILNISLHHLIMTVNKYLELKSIDHSVPCLM